MAGSGTEGAAHGGRWRRRGAAATLALALLALAGCQKGGGGPDAAASAGAAAWPTLLIGAEDVLAVAPGLVASGPVITGSLQPERRADLRAELGAVVLEVTRDNGQAVRAGELLVRLDDTAIRDALGAADESARTAGLAAEQAERQVARLKSLQAQGMVSAAALEDAELRRNAAASELVAARARAVAARQQLRRTEVRAPFDGVVAERKVSPGDTAQVGRELLKVVDPRTMRFEGLVSADRLLDLRPGLPVSFRVAGAGDTAFAGKVQRVDSSVNATTRQVEVRVSFDDPKQAPAVTGLYAEGRVLSGGSTALLLPESAVVRGGDGAAVWKVGPSALQRTVVTVGERDPRSGRVPVLGGLVAGDRVLRVPSDALHDGQRVETRAPAAGTPTAAGAASPAPAAPASSSSSASSAAVGAAR